MVGVVTPALHYSKLDRAFAEQAKHYRVLIDRVGPLTGKTRPSWRRTSRPSGPTSLRAVIGVIRAGQYLVAVLDGALADLHAQGGYCPLHGLVAYLDKKGPPPSLPDRGRLRVRTPRRRDR
jgi:hypothetical protein